MKTWKKYAFLVIAVLLALSMYKPVSDLFANNKQYTQESFQPSSITGDLKGNVREFKVMGSDFMFSPGQMKVKQGETVRIIFHNIDGLHDFKIDEYNVATQFLEEGTTQTVEYYCSVMSHRQQGMVGKLIVE
jgi:plastocyanin